MKFQIATRQSPLALRQTELVIAEFLRWFPEDQLEIVPLITEGDRRLEVSLAKIGGKGLFIKELEQALLDSRADMVVHSMKDLPAVLSPEFCMAAMLPRADPRDVLLSTHYTQLSELPRGAKIGTSSLRRQSQLLALRPDVHIAMLRGNLATRLRKLIEGEYDAIILAAAGVERLQHLEHVREYFSVDNFLPAAGQGAIGIECLVSNVVLQEKLKVMNHVPTFDCVMMERQVAAALQASCQAPIAIYAETIDTGIRLRVKVGSPDGQRFAEADFQGASVLGLPERAIAHLRTQHVEELLTI